MSDPTIVFKFSSSPINSGTSMKLYNTSSNWYYYNPANSSSVLLTITSLNGASIFHGGANSFTKTYTPADLVGDFSLEILASDIFADSQVVIPDSILTITIAISGSTQYTYSTDEVFYYNCWSTKVTAAFNAVDYISDINSTEVKYAGLINSLYQGLIADIFIGNTSGIYEKFSLFNKLSQ